MFSIYHTLITPYLTYGISAWGYCAKTHLNRLLILQKRALRLIFFRRAREHAIPLFIKSNCLPISFLFFQQLCYLIKAKFFRLSYDVVTCDVADRDVLHTSSLLQAMRSTGHA